MKMTTAAAKEHFRVTISHDGYDAYVAPQTDDVASTVSVEEMKELVREQGVVHGLDESALERAASMRSQNGQGILIASGLRPVNGKDGWAEILYKAEPLESAKVEQAKMDLRELHRIHNVVNGQRLVILHPPEAGVPGMKVSGETVAPTPGKKSPLRSGPHTSFDATDPACIVATVDGNAVLRNDGVIEVEPVVTIRGNIDFSTGNQDFVGSLIITGDVFSDFSVKVKKNLEIQGNVEDAQIEVGGSVVIKKGFVGHGKGTVHAAGNVHVAHVVNQTIVSQQDVIIGKESVAATIVAEGKILGERASIVGGSLDAAQEVKVLNLGSSENSQVHVQAGRRKKMMAHLFHIEQDIKQAEKQMTDVKDAVFRLIRMKLDTGSLPADKEIVLAKLQSVQKELASRLSILQSERTTVSETLKKCIDPKIIVLDTAFENAVIEINGVRKVLETTIKEVVFVEHGGAIEEHAV